MRDGSWELRIGDEWLGPVSRKALQDLRDHERLPPEAEAARIGSQLWTRVVELPDPLPEDSCPIPVALTARELSRILLVAIFAMNGPLALEIATVTTLIERDPHPQGRGAGRAAPQGLRALFLTSALLLFLIPIAFALREHLPSTLNHPRTSWGLAAASITLYGLALKRAMRRREVLILTTGANHRTLTHPLALAALHLAAFLIPPTAAFAVSRWHHDHRALIAARHETQ